MSSRRVNLWLNDFRIFNLLTLGEVASLMLQDFRMEESFWAHISLACSDARDAAHSRNQGMIAFKVGMDY